MIELHCPLCGSPVRAPNARRYTRLHCRKCHSPFHLDRAGQAVLGEPPDVERDVQELKNAIRDFRRQIPIKPIAFGALAVLGIVVLIRLLFGSSNDPAAAAKEAAHALLVNDAGAIRSLAASGTSDDAARWFEAAHGQLDRQRKHWYGKDELIEVAVANVDPSQAKAVVGVSIHPGFGTARDVTLADPAAATAGAAMPCDLETVWVRRWWGGWRLDGRETAAKIRSMHASTP